MKKAIYTLLFSYLLSACEPHSREAQTPLTTTSFDNAPEWAGKVIWYQIFVERFRNGDPTNDPTPQDIEGSYPGFVPDAWQITPWTQDWYSDDIYFDTLENGKDWFGNPVTTFGSKSQLRRYGGDLQGVLDQIDYLDSLGITAVYFNPLNDAPSLHKYDPRYWRHIDRNFGPSPQSDAALMKQEVGDDPTTWQFTQADRLFLKVIDALHKKNIRVILDYSWNHTGHRFWAWKDLLKHQKQSKYKDWYWVKQFDDPDTETDEFDYRGWFGVKDLPEIRETQYIEHVEKTVPDTTGNLYDPTVKTHIFHVARRWLDPNQDGDPSDGVDGYRLDVAAEMPFGFWREFRHEVLAINPEALLIGEVWWEQGPDKLFDPAPFLQGDVFDAVMNYRWYRSARQFLTGAPQAISATAFADSLTRIRQGIKTANNYAMMNLNGSHDSPRVLTSLFNDNMYKQETNPEQYPTYKTHRPDAATFQTLRLLLAHQYTYIGSPHIWAGDEMGMWGADDPSCRKPLIWPDYTFDPEATHPAGLDRPADTVRFDPELFAYYQKLIHIRKHHPVLMTGDIAFFLKEDEKQLLGYRRFDASSEILTLLNASQAPQSHHVEAAHVTYEDVLTSAVHQAENGKVHITLPPRSAVILVPAGNGT